MEAAGIIILTVLTQLFKVSYGQCPEGQALNFARWSGVSAEGAPVFVYAASGDEPSLAGACLARCRELQECSAVLVAYSRGNCHGLASADGATLYSDNDVAYFKKICVDLSDGCSDRWWALESTPGYNLHSEATNLKVVFNTTVRECYAAVLSNDREHFYRSAQWVGPNASLDPEQIRISDSVLGNCVLNAEDKFTEPESYRVSNYYTVYIENQCRHDYPKKIDRCSYEEYNNQTLKHVEFTIKNYTKDECKAACEMGRHFICRGFTWTLETRGSRGLCDLHSEDLVSTGSWLLRRTSPATYYRRVICLNMTVECSPSSLVVTYRARGQFRGRVYVPGRGDHCSASAPASATAPTPSVVTLKLPLYGDCDVNFAHAITNTPTGVVNRTMAYVMVMVQNNPIIQTAGDRWVRVGCAPERAAPAHVGAAVAVTDPGRPSQGSQAGAAPASAVYGAGGAPVTMYVARAQDAESAPADAVSLGEPLELRIETTDESELEAYHLVASSRLGDSSVLLLDSRGCPTGQVQFPAFSRAVAGGTQRLTARFKAFRFPGSHVVRFSLMVRFCDKKCTPVNCISPQARAARQTNDTSFEWNEGEVPASVRQTAAPSEIVAHGGAALCGAAEGRMPLELEMVVGSGDIMSADTMVRADHRSNMPEATTEGAGGGLVCVHELLLLALALAWLAVQMLLLLGCCVLLKRYRSLAELSLQKEYQAFDNVGFDTGSTHRRVHWPDQNIDILHAG